MRKIRWGVLGTAGIAAGCTIPGMLEAENCTLYAIAGRDPAKAADYQSRFGFEKAFDDYDALLADPGVEAVYIPLPNSLHCAWAVRALDAGKHVLCEKPLAPTVAEVETMFAAARENGVILMEAFASLHNPVVAAIRRELDAGAIGGVRYMESAFITSDYVPANIRMRRETFGGSVYDLGCYNTALALRLFGEEPETVMAAADFTENHIDIFTTALMTFSGGRRAQFNCGMVLQTEGDRRIDRLQIHGSEGFLYTDARFNQKGTLTYTVTRFDGSSREETVHAPDNYRLEVEQLGRCIEGLEEPLVTETFSKMNARTLERVLKSIGY